MGRGAGGKGTVAGKRWEEGESGGDEGREGRRAGTRGDATGWEEARRTVVPFHVR